MLKQDQADDEWGAALSEQAQEESTQSQKKANLDVFKDLADNNIKSGSHPDIDFIMDIPLHITVELGRTKESESSAARDPKPAPARDRHAHPLSRRSPGSRAAI